MTHSTVGPQPLGSTADTGLVRNSATAPRIVQYAIVEESIPSDGDLLRGVFPRESVGLMTLLESVAEGVTSMAPPDNERVFY